MAAIAGAALAVVLPSIFLGNASGHDFEFHLASWMEVARLWREGIVFPRWAELANYGYGEPRFIFYPPISWILGAALSFVLPWRMVPGAFILLALFVAGMAMHALARDLLPLREALLAALLYTLNPYHLVLVYWRSDFAELVVGAILPLAALYGIRAAGGSQRALLPLALTTALIWLTNAPAGVIWSYSLALMLAIGALRARSLRPLLYGFGGMALGLALASIYVVPAAFEQSWVNIAEVLSEGLRFPENFLFVRTADLEHTRFNFLVSKVAVSEMIATAIAIAVALGRQKTAGRADSGRTTRDTALWLLLGLAAASSLLMWPLTSLAWTYLPKLRFVQFPWRWALVLGVPFAFFVASAAARVRDMLKLVLWISALALLAATGFWLTRSNWWDPGGVTAFYAEHFRGGDGYFGADEYGPRGSDHYDLDRRAPRVAMAATFPTATAQVRIHDWRAQRKVFTVETAVAGTVAVRLLNYPAWRVQLNGKPVHAQSASGTGQMLVAVPAGASHLEMTFAATSDRICGGVLSGIALMLFVLLWMSGFRGQA